MLGIYRKSLYAMITAFVVAIVAAWAVPMVVDQPMAVLYAWLVPWVVAVVALLSVIGRDEENRLTVGKVVIVTLVAALIIVAVLAVVVASLVSDSAGSWACRIGYVVTIVLLLVESKLLNPQNVAAAQERQEERTKARYEEQLTAMRQSQQEAQRRAVERERRKRAKRSGK